MGILDPIRKLTSQSVIWPPIEYELLDAKKAGYLKGKILNAGAGWRDLSHLVDGELINQDITWPDDDRKNTHIFSPIHNIPVADNTFDTILCIAVLEHVENPEEIIPEFLRCRNRAVLWSPRFLSCSQSTKFRPITNAIPRTGWSDCSNTEASKYCLARVFSLSITHCIGSPMNGYI